MRTATPEDVAGITRVADALADDSVDAAWYERGTLVSGYSPDVYRNAIDDGALVLVAAQGGEVIGFLFGYPAELSPDPTVRDAVERSLDGPTFLIKQIGVLPDHAGRSIGSRLYAEVEQRTYPMHLAAAIVTSPPNLPSLRFHEARGFQLIDRFTPDDARDRFLLGKLRPTSLSHGDAATLVEQYKVAVGLYQHEDQLNWTKLNALFYLNAGLLAALGLLFQGAVVGEPVGRLQWSLVAIIAGVGFVAALVFTFALVSGTEYLQTRKGSVVDLEHRLITAGGLPVVDWHLARGETRRLWRSRTSAVLRSVPVAAALGWLTIAIVAVRGM